MVGFAFNSDNPYKVIAEKAVCCLAAGDWHNGSLIINNIDEALLSNLPLRFALTCSYFFTKTCTTCLQDLNPYIETIQTTKNLIMPFCCLASDYLR